MAVLLLRLAGPMQSWGTQSRFTVRDTEREPTKSGVVGLLGAALGMRRDDIGTIARLAALRMGVRVDREGEVGVDYHTAGGGKVPGRERYGVYKASGAKSIDPVVSQRHYLADADFLVGLEGDDVAWLHQLDAALANPVWPLYLGRKSFVPSRPVRIGLVEGGLEQVLRKWPWEARTQDEKRKPPPLRLVIETHEPTNEVRRDQPLSFDIFRREYRLRYLRTEFIEPEDVVVEEVPECSSPD